ncbi:MAG: MCE family protein [Bacteroidia bacterium]|nr:MCE family protein [Bacteroidia bacterium]MBT8276251.1 MCE family protein [Bacteroidia bacterium]NNJ81187.1 MCE family protein [Flavobacteriaceae bacterium]NNK53339.1 MCE family protein [Flavobacteriaceae bacterium]NNM07732.1 MCE family protein [Flavobacteriaceae bacterium]
MQKTVTQKIRLGVFVILGTTLLVSALYFIGNRQNLFGSNIELHAEFTNVNGLQLGNNVRYSGINSGTVKGIEMIGPSRIMISMVIEEKIAKRINKNAVATIGSDGLVGSMLINILPQEGESRPIKSGDTIKSYTKIGANDILTTLSVTNENAAILTSDLLKITTKIIDGKGTIGMLINDTLMADNLKESVNQLKKASMGANNAINQLNTIISSVDFDKSAAGVLLTDSVSGIKVKSIIDDLDASTTNIKQVSENLDTYLNEIKESEGAFNQLIKDEKFAKNLDSTLLNIKEATFRLNENMEALKHNFLFRGYFRKQERLKTKATRDSIKNLENEN